MGDPFLQGLGASEVVTTIRVSGVPFAVSEADFNCWFIFAPGFEAATISQGRAGGPQVGWARFDTVESAQVAIQHLNGRLLTQQESPSGAVLSAELAKKNFKPRNPAKQAQSFAPAEEEAAHLPWQLVRPPPQQLPPQPSLAQQPLHDFASTPPAATPAAAGYLQTEPCSTLFIWKLQQGCTEDELQELCNEYCTGFQRLKFVPPASGKTGQCWVKFTTVTHAMTALQTLSTFALASNPAEAIQIDFAKSDLDQPKHGARGAPGASAVSTTTTISVPSFARPVGNPVYGAQRGNDPCDTMFIGNVAASVSEDELLNALTTLHGFQRAKMVGEGTEKVMAFALFESTASCEEAISILHGNALPSAPNQAVICQFSKNSLGKASRMS